MEKYYFETVEDCIAKVNARHDTFRCKKKKKKKTRRQTSKGRRLVDFAKSTATTKENAATVRQYRISEASSAIRNYTGITVTPIYRDAELRINRDCAMWACIAFK